jgi:hypothetical protein
MREQEIRGIMEAYAQVYSGPEELSEGNPYANKPDSQLTANELLKKRDPNYGKPSPQQVKQSQGTNRALEQGKQIGMSGGLFGTNQARLKLDSSATKSSGRTTLRATPDTGVNPASLDRSMRVGGKAYDRLTKDGKVSYLERKPASTPAAKPSPTSTSAAPKPSAPSAAAKPSAPSAAAKPAPSAAPKPSATTEKDPMKVWAAAHPDLAGKVKPGQSGYNSIQQQRNTASLSAAAKPSASSTLGKTVATATAKPLGANFNPSPTAAPKPATPAPVAAAPKPATPTPAAAPAPVAAAPAPKPTPVATAPVAGRSELMKKQLNQEDLDIFDIVKGHLLDEGYAETEEAAIVMMANMSEEWRNSVLESYGIDIQETKRWWDDDGDNIGYEKGEVSGRFKKKKKKVTKEELEAWVNELVAEGYDFSDYTWEEVAEIYVQELELLDEDSARLAASSRKRAEEMGRKRRSTKEYKQGGNRGTGRNERAAYNLSNAQRSAAANPDLQTTRSRKPSHYDSGMHQGDYDRYNRNDPKKNPKHEANK